MNRLSLNKRFLTLLVCSCLLALTACGTNPVSGKRQIVLMTQSQEIALGEQQYPPSQQSQGGAYTLDPAVTQYVASVGKQLAQFSPQPNLPYEFVVLNNDVPNAWALPGGKIAINKGLLVLLEDEAQLAAVLGHEIIHAAGRHSAEQQATNLGIGILASSAGKLSDNSIYQQATALGANGFQAKYSRDNELEADKYGIDIMSAAGYDPNGAVELQRKLYEISQQNGGESDWFSALFASHPPSSERVEKNLSRAQRFPKGKRNEKQFKAAIAQLLKDQPAYTSHQQALEAASNKEWDKALSLTAKAITLQPREARFYITHGRLLDRAGDSSGALKDFSRATALEPNYFAPLLYKGLQELESKQYDTAQANLLSSYKLLATQPSAFYLGELALRNNDKAKATAYFKEASQGGGEMGKSADSRLKQLGAQ